METKPTSISKRNITIYYITTFLDGLVFVIPIIIIFFQGIITPIQISFIYGWRYFVQLVTELPTGAIADIFGKKISIIISFICFAICYALLPFSKNFWHVILIYTFSGLGNSLASGATEAIAYDSLVQDKKAHLFSQVQVKQNFFYQIGLIISTLIGGFMYQFNYALPFFSLSLSSIIAVFISFLYIEPTVDTVKFTIKNYFLQMKLGFKELFKNPHITEVSFFYIIVGGITWSCAMYLNSYLLVDLGFNDKMRGILEGGLRLINLIVLSQFLRNKRIFSKKNSFLFFPLAMMIGLLPGIFLNGYFGLPFIALAMMSSTARWIILGQYTNDEFDSKYRATAISALSMGVGLFYVAITITSGPIINYLGGVRTMYTFLGILSTIIILPLSIIIVRNITGR